jgi:predicted nucleotidyltransferase
MLAEFLTSMTRAEVLRVLFDGRLQEYYLRDIEKKVTVKINSLQKEIKHLLSIDLIKSRVDGNRIYYSANNEHPLYIDLVSIVNKTVGVEAQLKTRLKDSRIKCSFLFGSFAKNQEGAQSDIDLVVIGSIGMRAVTKLLSGLQEFLGREINPHVYSENEFKKRIKDKDHFVTSFLMTEKKILIGNLDEYR